MREVPGSIPGAALVPAKQGASLALSIPCLFIAHAQIRSQSCLGQDCSAALVDSGSDHRRLLAGVSGTCTCSGPEMALSLTGGCSSCRRGRPMTERARALHRVLCTCGCGTKPPRTMASSPRVPRWQCRCALPAGLVRSGQTETPVNSHVCDLCPKNQITWLLGLVA